MIVNIFIFLPARAGSVIADVLIQNITGEQEKLRYCTPQALRNLRNEIKAGVSQIQVTVASLGKQILSCK